MSPTTHDLDDERSNHDQRSDLYVPCPDHVKLCFYNPNPARYVLAWGVQEFDGPHITIVTSSAKAAESRHGMPCMEVYGCEVATFRETHLRVPGVEHGWYKAVPVRARKATEETEIVTVVDGRVESRSKVPAGYWIIENPGGEQYYNSPEEFARNYRPAAEASEAGKRWSGSSRFVA